MKQTLTELLSGLGYPVFLQGSLNPSEPYPDSFFTFWNFNNDDTAFYDNDTHREVWGFWVYFYSISPALVESVPEQARQILKNNGFILQGKATDISVDRPTHTGAMLTTYKFEQE